ncbi:MULTISPECIES: NYN domain-containing protein [unclassified Corynebacterium]|uniref:NYN domain-containing protein n=1 Tax=unclassified Corynebacterium TaxID=2624378 RepID=UPI00265058F2|nr:MULTISPECIES: NYN domain-containing protein [unclassified Corynebacterium]MDN8594210.1 NYN domain-containing protein [Corynebacterium sp. P4_F2]WKK55236.1 NYN domain-containing protein [Corynebacterium sp. P4-C1]WKK62646.1 NYN domain-containing protein [Corynebacterium sp. P8-C1]
MLERTLVFVDTSYLLASFYNSWETGARSQLEIDLPEVVNDLSGMIIQQLNQPIHRQFWYDGIPDSGPHRYQRALRTCDGVQLRTGQLIEWGERRTQKGVDTRLVADIVVNAMRGQCTDFVLVSGDADMIPGVEEATNAGIRVHLYGFGWDSMSSALRHACDTTTILDPREDFAEAMQLQVLEGPLPPTIRERPMDDGGFEEAEGMCGVPRPDGGNPLSADSAADAESSEDAAGSGTPGSASPTECVETAGGDQAPEADDLAGIEAEEPSESETAEPSATKHPGPPSPAQVAAATPRTMPKPSMMAPRRKLRSRYVPLPEEVWTSSGFQTPFDVGQQYATWWYDNAASSEQRDKAHMLSGGGLPPEIDRPLLQFACETLHEYTLSEHQRVNLRDGFHSGIRGVLINIRRTQS